MIVDEQQWNELILRISKHFKVTANYEFVLFVIGVNELGRGFLNFTKDEKMDIMNLGSCVLLNHKGLLKKSGVDEHGWPLYEPANGELTAGQTDVPFLKNAMIEYFRNF